MNIWHTIYNRVIAEALSKDGAFVMGKIVWQGVFVVSYKYENKQYEK